MKLYFYCNAVDDDVRVRRNIQGDSPAGTRKVIGLCIACRNAGVDARIVSMGRGRVGKFGWHGIYESEVDGVPITYGPMLHIPILSYIVTMLWLALHAWRVSYSKINEVHLFYNQLTFYLPALAVLRLRGCKTVVDIEDGPLSQSERVRVQLKSRFGSVVPSTVFAKLINGGALIANTALAGATTIRPVLPYYGAIASMPPRSRAKTALVHILASGTLEPDTGMNLLAEAIILVDQKGAVAERIQINITGQGPSLKHLSDLAKQLRHVRLNVLGRISLADYRTILMRADVGLSLKLIGGGFSNSTFPSKTVEYAQNGLMLISTDISDVRAVFGDTARYLINNDAVALAALIVDVANDTVAATELARQGQIHILEKLSYPQAGIILRSFLFESTS